MHMVGIFYVVFSQELEVTKQAFGILAPSQAHSITPSTLNGIFFSVFLQGKSKFSGGFLDKV